MSINTHVKAEWEPKSYRSYKWIVKDSQLLGGKLAIRGTRLAVSQILECIAKEWSLEEISEAFGGVSKEAITEVLMVAADLAGNPNVAA